MPPAPDGKNGFTLLEVVVTLAVLSISLTVLYQVFSSVARGTRVSSDYYQALEIAETQMALLSTRVTSHGASGTENDYFRWRSSATPYTLPTDSPLVANTVNEGAENKFQPYRLTVDVSWGEGRTRKLELNTILLENAQ